MSFARPTIPEEKWGTTRSLHGRRIVIALRKNVAFDSVPISCLQNFSVCTKSRDVKDQMEKDFEHNSIQVN